jgi:hypothetical protein
MLAEAVRAPGAAVDHQRLADAMVRTVAYADVFGFALTPAEVQRYLIGMAASRAAIATQLAAASADGLASRLSRVDGLITLAGREHLAPRRQDRRSGSAQLWPRAVRYARAVGSLPFVRMVAVSGALAAGNAVPDDDIDLFIVTETGRLWLARAGSIAVVRMARVEGHELCPNYLLAETRLRLDDRDLYAASEIGRMVPVVGRSVYDRMRALNAWTSQLLPNASGPPTEAAQRAAAWRPVASAAERALRTRLGSALESWERGRKVARFRDLAAEAGDDAGAGFSADRCKGHFVSHRRRIRDAYEARCRMYGTEPMWTIPPDLSDRAESGS